MSSKHSVHILCWSKEIVCFPFGEWKRKSIKTAVVLSIFLYFLTVNFDSFQMLPFLLLCQINKKDYCTIWLLMMWIFIESPIYNIDYSSAEESLSERDTSSNWGTYWLCGLNVSVRLRLRNVTQRSLRYSALFWNALILTVWTWYSALCRAVINSTATGHTRTFARDTSCLCIFLRAYWNQWQTLSLENFQNTWKHFIEPEI